MASAAANATAASSSAAGANTGTLSSGAAINLSASVGSPAAAKAKASPKPEPRRPRPTIDLDEFIKEAAKAMKSAQKRVSACRAAARNERRKKQRLLKKAAALTAGDLERIATLKRCGLVTDLEHPAEATPEASTGTHAVETQAAAPTPVAAVEPLIATDGEEEQEQSPPEAQSVSDD